MQGLKLRAAASDLEFEVFMSRRLLVILTVVCAAALVAPAMAGARSFSLPKITSVTPMRVAIGQKLSIRGRNFLTGTGRNTVVFQRAGGRLVFARAGRSSSHSLVVRIPTKLRPYLTLHNGALSPTQFRLNVLARRFGRSFTPSRLSPVVTSGEAGVGSPSSVCNPQSGSFDPNGDADHDLLTNSFEAQIHTDPCVADTDGDGIPDGYEVQSALDLNHQPITVLPAMTSLLPYPGKRPYPNALDPSDPQYDFDGDGLTLADEYHAWAKYGDTKNIDQLPNLLYSDGTQHSQRTALTDDLKDVDGDGITNWIEAHGPGQPEWWTAHYGQEPTYTLRPWAGLDWLSADTDGDGLKDGADDTDHDGYSDQVEMNAKRTNGMWDQPFNPCLPNPWSQACSLYPDTRWEPFISGWVETQPPLAWPRP